MGEATGIQWTDRTWSPWEGCTKVSPGCDRCYAASMNRWLQKGANWGPGAPRRLYSDEHWEKPEKWNTRAARRGERYRVFPSVCDPLDLEAPEDEREFFWALVESTPHLDWLLLTKRIGNAKKLLPPDWLRPGGWPKNARLGATMVNQEEWDRDATKLRALNVPNFVSIEPQIGAIDMRGLLWECCGNFQRGSEADGQPNGACCNEPVPADWLDWVIVGGESGRGAREFDIAWPRSIVGQCEAAGVPVFVKQMGDNPVWRDEDDDSEPPHFGRITYIAKAGGEPAEWPEDLRVREFPK